MCCYNDFNTRIYYNAIEYICNYLFKLHYNLILCIQYYITIFYKLYNLNSVEKNKIKAAFQVIRACNSKPCMLRMHVCEAI